MGENDEWIPTPGTTHLCGNCGASYPLYGEHHCSAAIPMPGPVAAVLSPVVQFDTIFDAHASVTYSVEAGGVTYGPLVAYDRLTAMQAERDTLRGQLTMAELVVADQEADMVKMRGERNAYKHQRDAAKAAHQASEESANRWYEGYLGMQEQRDAATARAERAERQRDHARAMAEILDDAQYGEVYGVTADLDDGWLP